MSRNPGRSQAQHRGLAAHLADDRASTEERGWYMLDLVGHAFLYLLLTATEAIWVVVTVVRVWRRRDVGLAGSKDRRAQAHAVGHPRRESGL